MEPAQANPLRRKRRWVIVAFVLVLVSTVAWWEWPRGDARFVGVWVAEGQPVLHRSFSRNGTYAFIEPSGYSLFSKYKSEGDHLLVGSEPLSRSPLHKPLSSLLGFFPDFTGISYDPCGILGNPSREKFAFEGSDTLWIWDLESGDPHRFTRIAE